MRLAFCQYMATTLAQEPGERHGISRDEVTDAMGGSP